MDWNALTYNGGKSAALSRDLFRIFIKIYSVTAQSALQLRQEFAAVPYVPLHEYWTVKFVPRDTWFGIV